MTTQLKPADKFRTVNGLKLHYLDWGSEAAQPMLLLHGGTGNAHLWDVLARSMHQQYHILALDHRGYGESEWAADPDTYTTDHYVSDIAALTEELGLDQFVLAGLSMGGRNAMVFAGTYPSRVARLIIADAGPGPLDPAVQTPPRQTREDMRAAAEEFDSLDAAVEWAHQYEVYRRASREWLRRYLDAGLKPLPNGKLTWRFDKAIRERQRQGGGGNPPVWDIVSKIACPTLVIRGAESPSFAPEVARRMLEVIPHSTLVEVPNSGHAVVWDNPQAFGAAVHGFLGLSGPE